MIVSTKIREVLKEYLDSHRKPELVTCYLLYLENSAKIRPVVFPPGKMIFKDADEAVSLLEKDGKVWREAEIKINFSPSGVNEQTKKIYICPFTGKVFGDNTHPNPQDAIYDWVSRCPENTERVDGLRVKRFLVSEDPDVIKDYMKQNPHRKPISKTVFSSAQSGKLYHSRAKVMKDFRSNYLKPMALIEVQNQNRFTIEDGFLDYLQTQLDEDKIAGFIEALAEYEEFIPYIEQWIEADEQESQEELDADEPSNGEEVETSAGS